MTPEPNPVLELRNVFKQFHLASGLFGRPRLVRALDGIDLTITAGEALAIVGESGSGKTTLARCLAGLSRPTSGDVVFEGEPVWGHGPRDWSRFRRKIQPVFQDPYSSLDPRWTVGRTIREALDIYGVGSPAERREAVLRLMGEVGLPATFERSRPHELSGGQCQRVGIAAALAVNPAVLVADEPVSALDVSVRAQVLNLLSVLHDNLNLTLVLITHDLAVVEHICDRAAVVYLGRIVEIGPVKQLLDTPIHPYTKALVAAIPRVDPRQQLNLSAMKGEIASAMSVPPGCRFHPRCPQAIDRCARVDPKLSEMGAFRLAACLVEQERRAGTTNSSADTSP
jgi:oligopeptide transport system ATP-binding protein